MDERIYRYRFVAEWSDEHKEWLCNPCRGIICGDSTPEGAVKQAREALDLFLSVCDKYGDSPPEPLS